MMDSKKVAYKKALDFTVKRVMKTPQKQIELTQDCVKVCSTIYHFKFDTITAISEHTGLSNERVRECFKLSEKEAHTWKDNSKYGLTTEGREYVEGLAKNSGLDVASQYYKFKDEALSGIIEYKSSVSGLRVSGRSTIERAVLPSGNKQHTSRTPEDFIVDSDRTMRGRALIAKQIGITLQELEVAYAKGLIAICNGCERVELFYADGKYRQGKCIKCMKKGRK